MKGLPPSLKHLVTGKASGEAKHLTMNLIQKHKSVTTQNLFEFVKSRNAANGITESPIRSLRFVLPVYLSGTLLCDDVLPYSAATGISRKLF